MRKPSAGLLRSSQFSFCFNGLVKVASARTRAILGVVVASLLALALVGCGSTSSNNNPPPPAKPAIASFAPTSGNPGTVVVISGSNLTGATSVKFNGTAATFTVDSDTQITATVGNGTSTGTISVVTPGGTAGSATTFTILNSPTITSFTPTSGQVGVAVTITGTNFTGATSVKFNGKAAASFTVDSATQITAVVATGTTTGKISVATPNGTGTSATNFTVVIPAPTITSFTPTSGPIGTSVVITGTNFTGASAVKFNGTTATFTVNTATQITAVVATGSTTGKVSVTTSGGTATSTTDFTVTVGAPAITSFNPTTGPVGTAVVITGLNFTGATVVKFNTTSATSFTVNNATQITATVPTGATTGKISVTTPGGTATSATNFTVTTGGATLDLSIEGLYITQATQNYPNPAVPLVQNRSAWVRVFVKANQANTATPQVKVDFKQGATTIGTLTINAPGSSVPLTIDPTNASASWNMAVDKAWIQTATTQVVATVDPTGAIAEADDTNNTFTQNLDVRNLKPWLITLVPVKTGDGLIGQVEVGSRTRSDWLDFAKRLHPVPDAIDIQLGTTMTSSITTLKADDSDGSWDTVLNEVTAKRTADGATNRYYYGAVKTNYSSGVAGLGWIGQPAAIGWDVTGSFPAVLAHEEGHNFNRPHSPCGGAGGPDPNYPYAGGLIGVPGWDVFATSNNIKSPTTYTDIMGYCSTQWISDYVYSKELTFRQNSPIGIIVGGGAAAVVTPAEGLLVWGRIVNGEVVLEPAFRIPVKNPEAQSGPYTWEAYDAIGRLMASVNFDAAEVADLPGDRSVRMFSFVVPLDTDMLSLVQTMRIKTGDQELVRRNVAAAADFDQNVHMQDGPDGKLQLTWDAERYPVIMVRDSKSGEVRGFLRGGNAEIDAAPGEVEVRAPDSTRAEPLRHRRVEF